MVGAGRGDAAGGLLATYQNDRGSLGAEHVRSAGDEGGLRSSSRSARTDARASRHQPADGMSLSVRTVRERWEATGGTDPPFAAVDGMNCPHLPPGDPRSHSLLLERGLIRVALPWPPRNPDGIRIDPEFTIDVVRDPGGCNTHRTHGLESANPTISYRRPRPAANNRSNDPSEFRRWSVHRQERVADSYGSDTGRPTSMNLMSDARAPTLAAQAEDAAEQHLQLKGRLTAAQLAGIVQFEQQVYVAQVSQRGRQPGRGRWSAGVRPATACRW